jgi:hypothetical protein
MAERTRLKRTSLFLEPSALARARRVLGATSDAEAVRMSLERIVDMERFWAFIRRTRRSLPPKSFEAV